MNRKTVPCKICGEPTWMRGTQLCDNCWEVERRLDTVAKTRAGRKLLWKALRQFTWWGKWLPKFETQRWGLLVSNNYAMISFYANWDWAWYRARTNPWTRFRMVTPLFAFEIRGHAFWGRKPDDR